MSTPSFRAPLAFAFVAALSACGTSRPNNFVPTTDVPPTDMGNLMCTDPQIACRGACLDPTSDAMNCGACGNVCAAGQACVQGVCLGACPTGQTRCGTQCVDTQTDRTHCGACDAACGAGLVCSAGACRATCGPMYMRCDDTVSTDAGTSSVSYCADVRTDERNCGGCGTRCAVGQVCEDGACVLHCPSAQTMCGDRCTDVQTDRANCGACETACTGTQRCVMGACTDQGCPGGFTDCTGACRDLMNDQANCGMCGRACEAPGYCVAGMCRLDCPFGRTACGTRCANVQTDTTNCGMCGRACAAGQVCEAGMCVVACPMGTAACMGRCVDLSSDRTNCGACGTACPAGQLCTGGSCVASCASTQITCAGRCVNAQSDPANCGACGIACPSGFACQTGICRPVAGADAMVCAAPSLRCGGTCTDPRTDNLNCGTCGNACTTDRVCANGTCAAPCAAGQIRCGAACVDGQNDPTNCGACGARCPTGQVCFTGACTSAPPTRYARVDAPSDVAFIDACAATGSTTVLAAADDSATLVALPFGIRFWDRNVAAGAMVNITSNGWVGMNPTIDTNRFPALPSTSTPNAMIAVHWGDDENRGGQCIATVGTAPNRKWVAEWNDARYCCGEVATVHLTYEVVITEGTNTIDLIYQRMDGAIARTAGLENWAGTAALGACPAMATSCVMAAGTRVRFTPIP